MLSKSELPIVKGSTSAGTALMKKKISLITTEIHTQYVYLKLTFHWRAYDSQTKVSTSMAAELHIQDCQATQCGNKDLLTSRNVWTICINSSKVALHC